MLFDLFFGYKIPKTGRINILKLNYIDLISMVCSFNLIKQTVYKNITVKTKLYIRGYFQEVAVCLLLSKSLKLS